MPHCFKEMLATDEMIRVFACGRMFHPIAIEMFGLAGGYPYGVTNTGRTPPGSLLPCRWA